MQKKRKQIMFLMYLEDLKSYSPFCVHCCRYFFAVTNCSFFFSSFKDLSHGLPHAKCTTLASQPAAALTSMAYHPLEPRMYTAALDGLVRCYDLQDEDEESLSENILSHFRR